MPIWAVVTAQYEGTELMPIKRPIPPRRVKQMPIRAWYSSTDLKTFLGPVINALFERNQTIAALGTPDKPLIELSGYAHEDEAAFLPLTVEDARDSWGAITAAVIFFGVPFIISHRGE